MSSDIEENKLDFDVISDISELSIVDPEEDDASDTLNVRKFLRNDSKTYRENNLTSIWRVTYENEIVAFFTISMNGMEAQIIPGASRVKEMRGRYPAILLGQMWVKPEFRGKKIGYWICQYVMGLARRTTQKIACCCVVLQTDALKISVYERARFIQSIKSKSGLIWMYQSIS